MLARLFGFSTTRQYFWVGLMLLTSNFFVFLFAAYSAYDSRQQIEHAVQAEVQNLSTTLQYSLAEKIWRLDFALIAVVREYNRLKNHGAIPYDELTNYLIESQSGLPELDGLRITNADGVVSFNKNNTYNVSLADRDYFLAQKNNRDAGLFVGKAVQSRVTGKWILPASRRLENKDGSFAGMVYATVEVDRLTQEFSKLHVDPNDTILLRDTNLRLITRYPELPGEAGQHGVVNASLELRQLVAEGRTQAVYYAQNTADGVARFYSFVRLQNAPLLVVVGKAENDFLAKWYLQLWRYFALTSVFAVLSAFAYSQMRKSWLAQEKIASELEETKDTLTTVVNLSTDFVYWRDEEKSQFHYCSPSCLDVTGYPVEAFQSDPLLLEKIIHPDDQDRWNNHLQGRDSHEPEEYRVVTQNGDIRWISHSCSRVYSAERKPQGRRGSHVDITSLKQAELALRASRDKAEAANIAKSRFLAVMSHELRTPLNGILGMAQIMAMPDMDEAERIEAAGTILGSGKILLSLLNDVLDHAKIEAGKMEIDHSPFSPADIVLEVADLFRGSASEKSLELITTIDGTLENQILFGDPLRIRQILTNFTNNALKFTEAGHVELLVSATGKHTPETLQVRFSVRDTGMGIPEERQPLLFQSFSQLDDSSTRRFGGTGLGLSICANLVHLMGGSIGVVSDEGQGSTFWFEITAEEESTAQHQS